VKSNALATHAKPNLYPYPLGDALADCYAVLLARYRARKAGAALGGADIPKEIPNRGEAKTQSGASEDRND
jgi:hypothetical protein